MTPKLSTDWTEENVVDEIQGNELELGKEDIIEILNGQASETGQVNVSTDDDYDYLLGLLLQRYRQTDSEAYRRSMDIMHDDMGYWVNPSQKPPLKPASVQQYSRHLNNYLLGDKLEKERLHYDVVDPKTGDFIIRFEEDYYTDV